ncbi:RT0821/Lpp0805 family surface protein [Breoghania sp. L-A4]|uniref:RT0821/Lpp0805 family surface protein n=1 Tax=Breoghania sp. L-A4 TaxID=2304600 RepID=UPI000E35B992|nr:RT0821/Lpp0805 family surface protein [Breoghania sp. L-A4]AXS39601.1 hypothetical protein D1F64_05490 [Breoghania sp. L-A4]
MNRSSPTSYNHWRGLRQYRCALSGLAIAALAAGALAGCAGIAIPLGGAAGTSDVNAPIDLTGNIGNTADLDVTLSDRRRIVEALPENPADAETMVPLAWANPETGNRGTITELFEADPAGNRGCARFTTSANTIEGLRNYTGMACPDSFNKWHVTVLEPAGS